MAVTVVCDTSTVPHWWCTEGQFTKAWAREIDRQVTEPDGTVRAEHFNLEISTMHNIRRKLANLHVSNTSTAEAYSWHVFDFVSQETFPISGGRFVRQRDDAANIAVSLLALEMETRIPDTSDLDYFSAPHCGQRLTDGLVELIK